MIKLKQLDINIIFLVIVIAMSTFLIGTPLSENVQIIYLISSIYGILYFLRKIIKREKIIIEKIDIIVIILCFSTIIPYITRNYVSLTQTINSIIKYMSLLIIYLISRQEIKKNNNYKKILINTIILSIFILCVIGLDEISFNLLKEFKTFLGHVQVQYDEVRIASLFAYPNTMAVVSGLGIFLSLGMMLDTKNIKYKILYIFISIIMLITFILTYSRLAYIFFFIFFIIYILIILKKYNLYKKINKKVGIFLCVLGVVLVTYIVIGLNIEDKLEVDEYYQKIFYNMKSDTDYKFSLEMKSTGNEDDVKIIFTEKNEFFDDINRTEISVGNYEGKKEISLHTKESTQVIYFEIKVEPNTKIEIENMSINNEKTILKYKLLPTNVINKLESINLNNKSAWERFVFISDATKLIKDNWLFGLGGNAWRTTQDIEQQYSYYASDVHCFFIQIFLEYGIIGFLASILIIVYIINIFIKAIKNIEKQITDISILIGIIFILAHSTLDFNMSFYYCLIIVFLLISILPKKKEETIKTWYPNVLIYMLLIAMLSISTYILMVEMAFHNREDNLIISVENTEEKIWNRYYRLLPFNIEVKQRLYSVSNDDNTKVKILEEVMKDEKYMTDNITLVNLVEYVKIIKDENIRNIDDEYLLGKIRETQNSLKYTPNIQLIRWNNIRKIINITGDENKKLEEQLQNEIRAKKSYMLNYEKCRYDKSFLEMYKKEIERIEKNEDISFNANI